MEDRLRFARHVGYPAIVGSSLLGLYAVPRDLFGCANRGWIALALILMSAIGAIVCMALAVRAGRGNLPTARLWLLSALCLLLPSLFVVAYELALSG